MSIHCCSEKTLNIFCIPGPPSNEKKQNLSLGLLDLQMKFHFHFLPCSYRTPMFESTPPLSQKKLKNN